MAWVAGLGETALPRRVKDRSARLLPRCRKSRTATLEPRRWKLRRLSEEPRCMKSSTYHRELVQLPAAEN